jgi:hypothetical protein
MRLALSCRVLRNLALGMASLFAISCVDNTQTYSGARQTFPDAYARVSQMSIGVGETAWLSIYPSRHGVGDGVQQNLRKEYISVSRQNFSGASVVSLGSGVEKQDGSVEYLITGLSSGSEIQFDITIRGSRMETLAPRIRVTPIDYSLDQSTFYLERVGIPLGDPIVVSAGQSINIWVESRNTSGALLGIGGLAVSCRAGALGQDMPVSFVEDLGDGSYHFTVMSTVAAAVASVNCSINGQDIPLTRTFQVNAGNPHAILLMAGQSQEGVAGTALAEAFVVRVIDAYQNPIQNAGVDWSIVSGAGSFGGSATVSTSTNAAGNTSQVYTLGNIAGLKKVRASLAANAGVFVEFNSVATPAPGVALIRVSASNHEAPVFSALPTNLMVQVRDTYANGTPGSKVNWVVTPADAATLEAAQTESNDAGLTGVGVIMGAVNQSFTIEATLEGHPAQKVTFNLVSLRGTPTEIVMANDPVDLFANANTEYQDPIEIQVLDQHNNPVVNTALLWQSIQGEGEVIESLDLTDEEGKATARVRLGPTRGQHIFRVTALVVNPISFDFSFDATVGNPHKFRIEGGGAQTGLVGSSLEPFKVIVYDNHDALVPDISIRWVRQAGKQGTLILPSGLVATEGFSTTGQTGIATAIMALGNIEDAVNVTATIMLGSIDNNPALMPDGLPTTVTFTGTSRYDEDARAFFTRVNALRGADKLTAANKKRVSDFVVGLKDIDLYSELREMWLMRSIYNAGQGCVVESFVATGRKGEIRPNTDCNEGWGADDDNDDQTRRGIVSLRNEAGQKARRIITAGTKKSNYEERTLLVSIKRDQLVNVDENREVYAITSNSFFADVMAGQGLKIGSNVFWGKGATDGEYESVSISSFQSGLAALIGTTVKNGSIATYLNGLNRRNGSFNIDGNNTNKLTDTDQLFFMGRTNAEIADAVTPSGLEGEMHFAADFNVALTQSQIEAFYNLYRTTVGQGLSLP